MRGRAALLAAGCTLASLDARADPAAQAFETWFLAVAGGCLACVVVELAAGKGAWQARLAMGVGFALLNGLLYLALLSMLIQVAPFIVLMLVAWVVPAARLWWLRRAPPKSP
jgi:hypothetical protein